MSNNNPKPDVLYSLQVPISAEAAAYIDKNKGDRPAAEKLAGYVRWMIDRQARGGLMIEPTDMDYLASLNEGQRFESSKDVVRAVEVALKRDDGLYAFTVKVDPTLVAPLEESASFQGLTAQQLLEMVVNQAMVNSWASEYVPQNGRLLPLDEASVEIFQRVTGSKVFNAHEVAAALERLEKFEAKNLKPVAA